MKGLFRFCLIASVLAAASLPVCRADDAVPRLETYFTAEQVDPLLGTPEGREKALRRLHDVGITKVYLEFLRSGYIPPTETLVAARDFFEANGIEVSTGLTATRGETFGEPSNQPGYWLNFESPKTQEDLREAVRKHAPLFRELMVDDFWATNDTGERSVQAKGERDWSAYRLELMARVGKACILDPAREANPGIRIIQKFPQWYDRFHKFGYDAVRAPHLYDRIWVGTETRNPTTKRFGYTLPTEGYINFSWLRSLAKDNIGGGWYDFGDCTPETYLMQAYQTVLAGAKELILFEAGSVLADNPCMGRFMQRRSALAALGEILQDRTPRGMLACKPPHSDGSDENGAANLYIYDYLAALGLAPIMTADVSSLQDDSGDPVFLPRQAADDPRMAQSIKLWSRQARAIVMTPDFLAALNDPEVTELAGFAHPFRVGSETVHATAFRAGNTVVEVSTPIEVRRIPAPIDAHVPCAAVADGEGIPLFTQTSRQSSGFRIHVLNLPTFTHEEFAPGKEEFLPPRPLSVTEWPEEVVNDIRQLIHPDFAFRVPPPVGTYLYDGVAVLANFQDRAISCGWQTSNAVTLSPRFPHSSGTSLRQEGDRTDIRIEAWELAVLDVKPSNH